MDRTAILSVDVSGTNQSVSRILARFQFEISAVKIQVTEGETAYQSTYSREAVDCSAKNTGEGWYDVFQNFILSHANPYAVEVLATMHKEKVTLVFRQKSEVPLKLCTLDVQACEEAEISLFDWNIHSAISLREANRHHTELAMEIVAAKDKLTLVEGTLRELQQRTAVHEQSILSKCSQLLNNKKDKIRVLSSLRTNLQAQCSEEVENHSLPKHEIHQPESDRSSPAYDNETRSSDKASDADSVRDDSDAALLNEEDDEEL